MTSWRILLMWMIFFSWWILVYLDEEGFVDVDKLLFMDDYW